MKDGSDAPQSDVIERRRALGRAIRQSRKPMTQMEVGAAVGRPQSCVSVWESGGIEIGGDRIFELEELFGVRHGTLLEAAGYIEPGEGPWWIRPDVPVPDAMRSPEADALGMMDDFPERLAGWFNEHGVLVEAAAVLRERGKESLALTMLLDIAELMHLRLAWEIWAGLVADRGGSTDVLLSRALSPMALDRCRLALWGQTSPGGRTLRLVGE